MFFYHVALVRAYCRSCRLSIIFLVAPLCSDLLLQGVSFCNSEAGTSENLALFVHGEELSAGNNFPTNYGNYRYGSGKSKYRYWELWESDFSNELEQRRFLLYDEEEELFQNRMFWKEPKFGPLFTNVLTNKDILSGLMTALNPEAEKRRLEAIEKKEETRERFRYIPESVFRGRLVPRRERFRQRKNLVKDDAQSPPALSRETMGRFERKIEGDGRRLEDMNLALPKKAAESTGGGNDVQDINSTLNTQSSTLNPQPSTQGPDFSDSRSEVDSEISRLNGREFSGNDSEISANGRIPKLSLAKSPDNQFLGRYTESTEAKDTDRETDKRRYTESPGEENKETDKKEVAFSEERSPADVVKSPETGEERDRVGHGTLSGPPDVRSTRLKKDKRSASRVADFRRIVAEQELDEAESYYVLKMFPTILFP